MSWQTLIIMQSVLVAISIVCLRVLARDKAYSGASFVVNAGMYVFLFLSMMLLLPWLGKYSSAPIDMYWWRFILGGVAFALTNVFTYKTLVYFDAAISTIAVSGLNAFFAILGAAMFLREDLSIVQILGGIVLMLGILYGVVFTQYSKKRSNHKQLIIGTIYALLAGLTFAVAVVNEKSLLGHMSVASYAVYGVGGQALMSILLAIIIQPKKLYLLTKPKVASWAAVAGILRGVGGVCFMLSEVRSNNVGLVSVISNFKLIIVLILGYWLLKERKYIYRKLSATAVALIGLTIMLWS